MLKLAGYDIVFQEVPGEVTLALNLAGCPNRCPGCHSPYLWEDKGENLDWAALQVLLEHYAGEITCVCFMGGDNEPDAVKSLCASIREHYRHLKTAWYSGKSVMPSETGVFSYLKIGPYVEALGGLNSPTTNQRFYKMEGETAVDWTGRFR